MIKLNKKLKVKNSIFVLILLFPLIIMAQSDSINRLYFQQRDFGKYFISDIYSPTMQIQVGMGLLLKDYNLSSNRKKYFAPFNQTDFGQEIPLFIKNKFRKGAVYSKFSLSMPLCARLWFDFSEVTTAPILNTDYNFALMELSYHRKIDTRFIKNFTVKFIPFFHESTHIGDELTIYRVIDTFKVKRVNVSYESAELAITFNDYVIGINKSWSFKIGVKALLNPAKGWYSFRTIEADEGIIIPTKHWLESYIQVQKQSHTGFMASDKFIRIFSLELRNRVQFGYPFLLDTIGSGNSFVSFRNNEVMRNCYNLYYGWKFNLSKTTSPPKFGIFYRLYAGINPYGQFRNIPFYLYNAISIIYQN